MINNLALKGRATAFTFSYIISMKNDEDYRL
jgi:hypothetical protein